MAGARKKNTAKIKSLSKKRSAIKGNHADNDADVKLEPVPDSFNSVVFPEIFNFIRKTRKKRQAPDVSYESQSLTVDELDRRVRNMLSDLMMRIIEEGDRKRFEALISEYRAFINDLSRLIQDP